MPATKNQVLATILDLVNGLNGENLTRDIGDSILTTARAYSHLCAAASASGDIRIFFGADAGSNDTYSITVTGYDDYVDGDTFFVFFNTANTEASTFNVSSKGAKDIRKSYNVALETDDIKAGQAGILIYDAGNDFFQLIGGSIPKFTENVGCSMETGLSADGKYSGIITPGTSGDTLVFGDLCYLQTSDSRWEKFDADAESTASNKLGMCLAAAGDGNSTKMLLYGNIRADSKFPTMTVGAKVFGSTTPGGIQTAAPSGSGDIIRVIGFGNTADELFFYPSSDYYEVV